jgi:hypothetical protein
MVAGLGEGLNSPDILLSKYVASFHMMLFYNQVWLKNMFIQDLPSLKQDICHQIVDLSPKQLRKGKLVVS